MGNVLQSYSFNCLMPSSDPHRPITLILSQGPRRTRITGIQKRILAGEIMFEFPHCMVCHADSFFIGQPIQALSVHDRLIPGQTYFIIPTDCLGASSLLSASNLTSLSPKPGLINFGSQCPFEYLKGVDGRALIKVAPEFIERIVAGEESDDQICGSRPPLICSTPELQKRYDQVVIRSREHVWSPRLETISEHRIRVSPWRFILDRGGMEWKQKVR